MRCQKLRCSTKLRPQQAVEKADIQGGLITDVEKRGKLTPGTIFFSAVRKPLVTPPVLCLSSFISFSVAIIFRRILDNLTKSAFELYFRSCSFNSPS